MERYFYSSNLLPAAPVSHGYRNFWLRDGWYVGICSGDIVKKRIWKGMIDILDRYKWKLEIHAKKPPTHWWEHIHVRYDPDGREIPEGWLHNQWDAVANSLEVAIDCERTDLASLLVDYLNVVRYQKKPAAGAWEDRNTCDAYSLAACIHALQRSKSILLHKYAQIDEMMKRGCKRLFSLLPYATSNRQVCLSLLGVIWPYNLAGPYKQEIIDLVCSQLKREPFGFIRYVGDTYSGEHFSQGQGREFPWILGDLFMAHIEPENPIWMQRLDTAYDHFHCMPEAFDPVTLVANRNTPLLWAEAMWSHLKA